MHTDLFNELTQSLKEATAIAKGQAELSRRFVLDAPDVKAVREKMGLTQDEAALKIGITQSALAQMEMSCTK